MSDIDFDELDKAVNSLVGDDGPKVEDKVQPNEAPKIEEPIKRPETTSTPSLPSRRGGRFMDMKHDSPIMNKGNSSPSKTSSGVNIQPISANVEPESNNAKAPETDKPNAVDQPPKDNTNSLEPETKFEETDPKKDDDKDDDKKPSPFIDDAKVEKRPLGGLPGDKPPEPAKDDDKKDKDNKDDDKKDSKDKGEEEVQTPPEPVELPPELDKDLVAIEAGEAPEAAKVESKPEEDNSLDSEESPKEDSKEKNELEDEKESPKDHKEEISQLLASAAGGSIPDQYKRENRSHELHTPHPLFDADHHKDAPVNAPKKPKSKMMVVFNWIFIGTGILLGGASLGAAVFYFTSQ